jgi:hypothetical protein
MDRGAQESRQTRTGTVWVACRRFGLQPAQTLQGGGEMKVNAIEWIWLNEQAICSAQNLVEVTGLSNDLNE